MYGNQLFFVHRGDHEKPEAFSRVGDGEIVRVFRTALKYIDARKNCSITTIELFIAVHKRRHPMPLSLVLVDELIQARRTLQGGGPGAPRRLEDGSHEGRALNRACVVMLSAALQGFISDVFISCSEKAFGRILNADEKKLYIATWSRWGNPSDKNIISLFRRLGINDVFDGLSWQRQSTDTIKKNLDHINQVRNRIAHAEEIRIDNQPYSLRLSGITIWRNVAENFGNRFEAHALGKIRR